MFFHHLFGSVDERLSATHSHTSTDANDVRCVESSHISQSLPQIVRDLLPFFYVQLFGRLAIDTPYATARNQCLKAIWRAAFALHCRWVGAAKMDGLMPHFGMCALLPSIDSSVYQKTSSHTCADGQIEKTSGRDAAPTVFADRGNVGIHIHMERTVPLCFHNRFERNISPGRLMQG